MGTAFNRPATQETGSRRWPTKEQRARLALDRQTEGRVFARSMHPRPLTCIVQDKVAHWKTAGADSTKALSGECIHIWVNYLPMSSPSSHRSTFLAVPDQLELEPSTLPRDLSVTEEWDCAGRAKGVYHNDIQRDTTNLASGHGGCVSMTQEQEKRQRPPCCQEPEKYESVLEETKSEENHEGIFAFEQQIPQTQDPDSKNPIVSISEFFLLLPTTHRGRSSIYKAGSSPRMLTPNLAPSSSSTSSSRPVSGAGLNGSDSSTSSRTDDSETRVQSSNTECQSTLKDDL